MKIFLGIDTGINSTGVVGIDEFKNIVITENFLAPKNLESRKHKFNYMCDRFSEFLESFSECICGCFLEDHMLRRISKKSTSIFDINRLDGRVEQILYSYSIPFLYIRVDHIKQVVDCTTRDSKELVVSRVMDYFGEDFSYFGSSSDDMADAYILAKLLSEIPGFKRNPKDYCRLVPNIGAIIQNYSAFIDIKE